MEMLGVWYEATQKVVVSGAGPLRGRKMNLVKVLFIEKDSKRKSGQHFATENDLILL